MKYFIPGPERYSMTFLDLRLAFALNRWALFALARGDFHLSAQRQRLGMQLIGGVKCLS